MDLLPLLIIFLCTVFGTAFSENSVSGILKLSFKSNRVPLIVEICLFSCQQPTWTVNLKSANINQSVEIPISDYWLLNNKFVVRVFDGHNAKDLLGFKQIEKVSAKIMTQSSIFLEDGGSLKVAATIACNENYYGERCTKLCIPDAGSNFVCLEDGSRGCKNGWKGRDCEIPSCPNDCSKNGRCVAPNKCQCVSGYRGYDCSECIPLEGCVHGKCSFNQTNTCQCDKGWAGPLCDIELEYCKNHNPCLNGASCYNGGPHGFKCQCANGYMGLRCEISVSSQICRQKDVCKNGGRCIPKGANVYDCNCPSNFKGRYCEIAVETCETKICSPNSICFEKDNEAMCKCKPCYFGANCTVTDSECLVQIYGPTRITVNSVNDSSDATHGLAYGALISFIILVIILSIVFVLLYKKITKLLSSPSMDNKLNEQRQRSGRIQSETSFGTHEELGYKRTERICRGDLMHDGGGRAFAISFIDSPCEHFLSRVDPPPEYSKAVRQTSENLENSLKTSIKNDYPIKNTVT